MKHKSKVNLLVQMDKKRENNVSLLRRSSGLASKSAETAGALLLRMERLLSCVTSSGMPSKPRPPLEDNPYYCP
jgi:hypothetical protein